MGTALPPADKELYRRIDEVLHYIWDPIGIAGSPRARDEYYAYLPRVFEMIKEGVAVEKIASYLGEIEAEHMGLNENRIKNLTVAIVPDSVPLHGPGGWIASQSCLVLRAPPNTTKFLYMYLRSEIGQSLFRKLVTGTTVPLISLRDLQALSVVKPLPEEAQYAEHLFDEQAKLQTVIEASRKKQLELAKALWSLG